MLLVVAMAGLDDPPARADRVSIGASVGLSVTDGDGTDSLTAHGLLARLRATDRLSLEGELDRVTVATSLEGADHCFCADYDWSALRLALLGRADLVTRSTRLVPFLLTGGGVERWSGPEVEDFTVSFLELGAGADVRIVDHFHAGADFRIGWRRYGDPRRRGFPAPSDVFGERAAQYVGVRVTLAASF